MTEKLTQIRLFLLDMDGTFNLGDQIIPGALEFIETLRRQGKDFVFVTNNSSKHRRQYAEKITRLGLPVPPEKIFTSGEAAALHIKKEHPGAAIHLVGTLALAEELEQQGLRLVSDNPEIVVLGFDTGLTYDKLWKLCDFVRTGLPYIATHPDYNCPTETGFMPDIGATIAFVHASTGRHPDLVVGKPNRMIVETLAEKLHVPESEMAMVGDRLYTDIALGENSEITTCLVLSGETRLEDLPDSLFQPDYIFDNLGVLGRWLAEH